MMSGLMTEKIDELFTALIENKPITHAQIHRAKSEYNVLRAVAQKAEQQRSAQKQRTTPRQPVEEEPVFSLDKDPVLDGESVTCPYCKQKLNQGKHRTKSTDGRVGEDYEDYHNKSNELQVEVFQLKQEIHRKNREIKDSEDQIKRLKSKISGAALSNNPNIIDLNDPNRSLKIGEKYSELYDNEWTDAFYYLENSANLREDKILDILQRILRAAYEFCRDLATAQLTNMEGEILCPLTTWTENKRMENIKQRATPSKEIKKVAQQFRKSASVESIPTIQQIFTTEILPEFVDTSIDKDRHVRNFAKACVQITWYMCIQDPPMHLVSKVNRKSDFDTNIFRFYTKQGDKFDFVVWPALLLHDQGPLVTKGVAQPYDPMNKSISGSKRSLRSPKSDHTPTPTPIQMVPPVNHRRPDEAAIEPSLRGTPYSSHNLSIAETESVDLPPMPDQDHRQLTPHETVQDSNRSRVGSREKSNDPNLTAAWRKNTPV